ncbi:MAG TPA: hypothetical protein VLA21_11925, partial [Candidatus Limnocylindria bacterium]|nr:hypothetical protein [Candidatus Limnocylindria bacterium]
FDRFLADQVAPCADSPRLHVLRRGSPHVPASAYDGGAAPCGGYFLQHGRTGAAVDPGPGFVADFMDAGFAFSQVGSVFISNAQEGQCGGLASILALLHAYNEGVGRDVRAAVAKDAALGRFPDLDGRTEREILEALSAEYERRFSEQRKRVDVYLSLGAFRTHAPLLAAGDPCGCRAHVLEAGHPPVELGDGVRVLPIPAWRAGGDCGQGALGLVWEFETSALVYTGETAYTPRIGREYAEIRGRLRSPDKPVALLARLGGSGKTEKDVSEGQLEYGEAFRGDCLGRNGVIALADALRPGLVILSGMGEELCGQRARLAGLFGDVFGDCGIRFLPADAGFCINGALEVWAVDRVDYSQGRAFPVLVRRFVPYASVRAEEEGAHILYYNAGTRADVDGLMSQALQGRRDGRKNPLPHEAVLLAD